MSKNIAIIGGGGFAKEVIEVALMLGYDIYGIFAKESSLKEYDYCGYLDELLQQRDNFDGVIIAIGAVNRVGMSNRKNIIEFLKKHQIEQISLISPLATISESVTVGKGVYIAHNVLISCDVIIKDSVLINHLAVIGHDCLIQENVSIAPQVFLGGNVQIKSDVMIGAASTLIQGITVEQNSIISMRANVIKNVKADSSVIAMPSKIYRSKS